MYKLIIIARLFKRVRRKPELAACAIAALLLLSALAAPARAQNTYGGATVVHRWRASPSLANCTRSAMAAESAGVAYRNGLASSITSLPPCSLLTAL